MRPITNIQTSDILFFNKTIKGFWLFKYLNELNKNGSKTNKQIVVEHFYKLLKEEPNLFASKINKIFKPVDFQLAIDTYRTNLSEGKVLLDFS